MEGMHDFDKFKSVVSETGPIDLATGVKYDNTLLESETNLSYAKLNIDVVPISCRYNFNGGLGVGFWPQISFDISNNKTGSISSNYFYYNNGRKGDPIEELTKVEKIDSNEPFSDLKYGLFGDITIGASRIGPSIGARYIYNFNEPHAQLHLYAIWKL